MQMMPLLHRRAPLAAALAIAAVLAFPTPGAAQVTSRNQEPITRELALVTFDSAWNRIRVTHYDSAMRGVDWNAVRDSLRPRAASAATLGDLRSVIGAMLATLGESHFTLIPQEGADALDPARAIDQAAPGAPGEVGLDVRLVGDTVLVTSVRPGSAAARAGVRPGWVIDSVGRYGPSRQQALRGLTGPRRQQATQMVHAIVNAQFAGPVGSTVAAIFRDARDQPVTLTMTREPVAGTPVRFGNLPTMFVEATRRIQRLADGGCAGIIRLSVWMLTAQAALDSAVDAVRECDGVVLDIRGNPGGVGGMVMGFGGHFLDSAYTLGVMKTRGNTLRFVANPRRANVRGEPVRPFAGKVAILVDSLSMSTSEIFAAGMQALGRARIFGENTPGLALPALMTRMPTGDVLMYVMADFTDPNGRRIEGAGVPPDEPVPLRRSELLGGRDAALEAALAWIGRNTGAGERVMKERPRAP